MKRKITIVISAIIFLCGSVLLANNNPGGGGDNGQDSVPQGGTGGDDPKNPDDSDNPDDNPDDDTDPDPDKKEPTNCSVVFEIYLGNLPHELNNNGVYLRLKRLRPSPLLFSPESLVLNSPFQNELISLDYSDEDEIENNQAEGDAPESRLSSRLPGAVAIQRKNGGTMKFSRSTPISKPGTNVEVFNKSGKTSTKEIFDSGTKQYTSRIIVEESDEEIVLKRIWGKGESFEWVSNAQAAIPFYVTKSGRRISGDDAGAKITYAGTGFTKEQVVTAQRVNDIKVIDQYCYEVRQYPIAQKGIKDSSGRYQPVGTPFAVWRIENPNRDTLNNNEVLITKTIGQREYKYRYLYSESAGSWDLVKGTGENEIKISKTILSDIQGANNFNWKSFNKYGEVLNNRSEQTKKYSWGEALNRKSIKVNTNNNGVAVVNSNLFSLSSSVSDLSDEELVTEYDYYDDSPDEGNYGKLKSEKQPDGYWEYYEYDNQGRDILTLSPWLDSPFTEDSPDTCKAVYYDYTPVDPNDILLAYDTRPRKKTVRALGQIIEETYYAYFFNSSNEFTEVKEFVTIIGSSYGDESNLREICTYYAPDSELDSEKGRLKTKIFKNGRMESYSYLRNEDDSFETTIIYGTKEFPEGIANKTTKVSMLADDQGNEISKKTYVFDGVGYQLVEEIEKTYSNREELIQTKRNGRITYSAVYEDAKKISETDEQGVTTLFTYDDRERVSTMTVEGKGDLGDLVTTYEYDALGRKTKETILGNGLSLAESWTYDGAGRITSYTNQAGYVTNYQYLNGGRTKITTYPNTSVVTVDRYLDRKIKSKTGSGMIDEFCTFIVNNDGSISKKKSLATENSPRYSIETRDILGRKIKETTPAFGGGEVSVEFFYNENNLLAKQTQPELADILYQYDDYRQPLRSGYDFDENNQLDLASTERIKEKEMLFYQGTDDSWWKSEIVRIYANDNQATTTKISEKRIKLNDQPIDEIDREVSIDIHGNETVFTSVVDRAQAICVKTLDLPSSNLNRVSTYQNNMLISWQSETHGGTDLYQYDGLYRKTGHKKARHTQFQAWAYDPTTGELISETDAAGNQTQYLYHAGGTLGASLLKEIIDAVGNSEYRSYNSRNQLTQKWGGTAYPITYGYDIYGIKNKQSTFRTGDFTFNTFPISQPEDITTWIYDEPTGLLTRKEYADGKGTDYSYTPIGHMDNRLWERGVSTDYDYDQNTGELVLADYSDNTPDVSYTYNRFGQTGSVSDVLGTRSFAYNTKLQLESETYPTGEVLARNYEDATNLPGRYAGYQLADAGSNILAQADYAYATNGRMQTVSDATDSFTYNYVNGSNLLLSMASPSHTVIYEYETNRDVKTLVDNQRSGISVSKFEYQYDSLTRRTSRTQSGTAFSQSSTDTITYNDRSEVISSVNDTLSNRNESYAFDNIGNRTTALVRGNSFSYGSNSLNQYDSIQEGINTASPTFDNDGNTLFNGENWNYVWDGENRLIEATNSTTLQKITFEYDYLSRRVRENVFTLITDTSPQENISFLYDGWNLIHEKTVLSSSTTIQNSYLWGLDLSNSMQGAGGVGGLLKSASGYYTFDVNGNVSEVLDAFGNSLYHYEYDSFGNELLGSLSENSFKFSTKYFDNELGLNYYGYRYYNQVNGNWISRDPIGELGGFNLYGMVVNNPIGLWDMLGLQTLNVNLQSGIGGRDFAAVSGSGGVKIEKVTGPNGERFSNSPAFRDTKSPGVQTKNERFTPAPNETVFHSASNGPNNFTESGITVEGTMPDGQPFKENISGSYNNTTFEPTVVGEAGGPDIKADPDLHAVPQRVVDPSNVIQFTDSAQSIGCEKVK